MKNILIVSSQAQRFLDQIYLAQELKYKNDDLNIFFFVEDEVNNKYQNVINKLEFKIINTLDKQKYRINQKKSFKTQLKNIIPLQQKKILIEYINNFRNLKIFEKKLIKEEKYFLDDLEKKYDCISELVRKNKIEVILINGDRHLGYEPIFLKISKKFNIPTIIPYLVYFAEEETLFKSRNTKFRKSMMTSSYIKQSEKKFILHKREEVFYYSHTIANALEKFGIITKNPWFMGSGLSDIICLANENMKKYYVKNGVEKEKIRITGDVSYDKLYYKYMEKEDLKENIINKYKLCKDKQNIIISLPQLGEHNILPWKEHWKEINFLMDNIDSLKQNILVSLHPKMDKNKYLFLEDRYNCKILEERLVDILVVADIFVATFSSTVIWSVLCGIKTLVIDFYGLNYTIFDFLTSIIKVDNKKLLKHNLNNILASNIDFTQDWQSLSKNEVFDGKTIERYSNIIEDVK